MLIAQQKRKENIAEYLLYLWQVEDLLRACHLDIDMVDKAVISRYEVDDATRHEIREWYESLIKMMELENVREKGHIRVCHNVLIRLNDLHQQLLADQNRFPDYHADYYRTLPFIVQLRATLPEEQRPSELETCFNALYGKSPKTLLPLSVRFHTSSACLPPITSETRRSHCLEMRLSRG